MLVHCPDCDSTFRPASTSDGGLVACPSCGASVSVAGSEAPSLRELTLERVGRFKLVELLGRGQFGEVYSARDPLLDCDVAVKVPREDKLSKADIERFLREARAAAQLTHPNIVHVREASRDGETPYIVSDLVRGVTLAQWLAENRAAPRQAAELTARLADALDHAHEAGVVHRDLKPSNVMLDAAGEPRVMDFGLARRDSGDSTLTVEGCPLGTPAYMSPEQARGDAHAADRRSDVYSLGVILFELLTGQRPFRAHGPLLLAQVLEGEPRRPRQVDPDVPRDLETICLKALEKTPEQRYATAGELAADLRRFLEGEPIRARSVGRLERGWRWARRRPRAATATILICGLSLLLGAAAWGNYSGRGENGVLGPSKKPPPPQVSRTVLLTTEPVGARVVFVPIDPENGELKAERAVRAPGKSPVRIAVPPGEYLVVVDVPDHGFHEVHRHVPTPEPEAPGIYPHQQWQELAHGEIGLPTIHIPKAAAEGMVPFEGGKFTVGMFVPDGKPPQGIQPHPRTVVPFLLDATEVTVGEWRRVMGELPTDLARLDSPPSDDEAVTFVDFAQAVVFAETVGKRLPTEFEYEYAATAGGTRNFPWGDAAEPIKAWTFGPVRQPGFDHTDTNPPVYGLYSNVAEWTDSWNETYPQEYAIMNPHTGLPYSAPWPEELRRLLPVQRVVRGGAHHVVERELEDVNKEWSLGPRCRGGEMVDTREAGLGFRCARSQQPRFLGD